VGGGAFDLPEMAGFPMASPTSAESDAIKYVLLVIARRLFLSLCCECHC
jgi:hypothetical protein